MQKLPNCSGSSSLFHSSLSDQQITKSGWQPRFMCVSQHQILAGSPSLQPSDAVGLPGLPALSPCLSHHSYTEQTEHTKHQASRETEEMMIVEKMVFLQELLLQAQQCCHSGAAAVPILQEMPLVTREQRGITAGWPHALGAKRSLHTRFLKGKNKSFPQLS